MLIGERLAERPRRPTAYHMSELRLMSHRHEGPVKADTVSAQVGAYQFLVKN